MHGSSVIINSQRGQCLYKVDNETKHNAGIGSRVCFFFIFFYRFEDFLYNILGLDIIAYVGLNINNVHYSELSLN